MSDDNGNKISLNNRNFQHSTNLMSHCFDTKLPLNTFPAHSDCSCEFNHLCNDNLMVNRQCNSMPIFCAQLP